MHITAVYIRKEIIMPLKKRVIKADKDDEYLRKLRSTDKWKLYYSKIFSEGGENTKKLSEEKKRQYIDKLVQLEVDKLDPMKDFDNFWLNIHEK